MSISDKLSRLTPEQRAALALRLSSTKRAGGAKASAPLPEVQPDPEQRYEPFSLSDIQQAYLIGRSEGVELGNTGCYCYFEVETTAWDRERFQSALRKVIDRHEMLRAIVLPEGRQQILQHVEPYEIKVQDLRGMESAASQAKLDAVRTEMSAYVHPTDQWPLFDFRASLLDGDRTRLHVGMDLLIADGRSFEVIFGDLMLFYRDPAKVLPALELSYRDYLVASEAFENSGPFQDSREYWMKRLATLPGSPELPLAMNPSSIKKPQFNRHRMRLDVATWRALKDKTSKLGLTAPGVLLAAYAEVLAMWSKNARFTLNLTLFNRLPLHKQANDIVGDFTSVNLLEFDNTKAEGFEARARQQQEQLWQDLDHRHFSGVRVMRELTRMQGVGPKAIMPVVFTSLLNIGGGGDEGTWAGRMGQVVFSSSQTPQVYLDFVTHEDRGTLVVDWFAVDEVFAPHLIDDMFAAFEQLLQQLSADDSAWSRNLAQNCEKLLPAYQTQLLNDANNTKAPVSEEFLHTLFLKQVELRPQQLAVCTPNRRMTYAEVYSRACRIEEELLPRGLEPNQFVGVVMEKGWEQVVAVLGILFAGGAYMPIDPDLPPERQKYLIENGDVKVVLTQSSVQSRLSVPDDVHVYVVDQMEPLEGQPLSGRTRQKLEDLAYVIYTSGSTGQPKGVMIDHLGAVNTCLDINQRFNVGPDDKCLALSRLNFDLSVYDIFGLLAAGGTIVMPAAELAQDTAHWAQLVASEKVTIWNTVPALMGLLVEQAERGENIGQSLRVIMMSGDWIPVPLPGQIRKLLPKATIMSLGGATEASIWSILYPIEQVDGAWKSIPYGKPMLNQTFHVLNSVEAPCPVWVPGQLYIGGIGLAKGYWRDARKTGASFIHHANGQRLYRTGDWGRYLPDGNIEFLGREDLQVKVQGYRIELGEIEAKILEHPDVENCVVAVREDVPGEKRLVGYVIPKPGATPQFAQVREFLRAKLPEYMIPSAFVSIDQFPLTANGKVDRKTLPAPVIEGEVTQEKAMARDLLEVQLTRLWEKILNVHPVGLRDNFFDIGGNSLMAVRLFSELRKITGRAMALSTLFQAPTVEKLAELLRNDGWMPNWSSLVPIHTGGTKPPLYCVHGGGGNVLLFYNLSRQLGPDYPFYGLQAQGLDGSKKYLTTVESMAEHYLKEVRELQPEGPYYLAGFCMGGQIAFEMAQRLVRDGQRVAMLVMIDTYNFNGAELSLSLVGKVSHVRQKVAFHVSNFNRLGSREKFGYLAEKMKGFWSRESEKASLKMSNLRKRRDGNQMPEVFIEQVNDKAYFSYKAGTYPGKITIFKPRRNYAYLTDATNGWGKLVTGGLDFVKLPVDPGGIFIEPYVNTLAEELKARIEEASHAGESTQKPSETPAESVLA